MSTIFCTKLQKEAEALASAPFPGPLGEKISKEISREAWSLWVNHQTMLINEYRLNMMDLESRKFLHAEMEKFLFGQGSDKPTGYQPVSE